MQVYLVTMPDKYPEMLEGFRNFQDIEPSIRFSYSGCQDIKITVSPKATGGPEFTITGVREGEPFKEKVLVKRLPLWDSPTHI